MYTCPNCGTEYETKYLQCPNCGCTRSDIKDAAKHDKRTEKIGGIIAIVFVVFLIILIAYGGYLLLNPFKDGPISTSVTTVTTTTTQPGETTSKTTTTRTTTTRLVGTEITIGTHTIIAPAGYTQTTGALSFMPLQKYGYGSNIYLYNGANNVLYYIGIVDSASIKLSGDGVREEYDNELTAQGFGKIHSGRFNSKAVVYAIKPIDANNSQVLLYYNKNSDLVITSFNIQGSKLNDTNTLDIIKIITSIN